MTNAQDHVHIMYPCLKKLVNHENITIVLTQRSVWPGAQSDNSSHSTLYPDVLKIKTIIVVKQKF